MDQYQGKYTPTQYLADVQAILVVGSQLPSSVLPRWLPAACNHIRPHANMPGANALADINANAKCPCPVPMPCAHATC